MEEIISKDDEENTHIDIEDNNEFNSRSSSGCDTNSKNCEKEKNR
jgi:hypothetical protein